MSTPDTPHLKAYLRRHYTAVRGSLSLGERAAAERAIFAALFDSELWQNARQVCAYIPVRGELDTLPLWDRARLDDKSCAVPVTLTGIGEGQMVFRRLGGRTPRELPLGRFGIPEPPDTCPTLTPAELEGALILVPGLVFDDQGFRVGYGGGYYDRFLADLRARGISVTAVGLAYSVCRTQALPREVFDRPVDYVIDERRMIRTHGTP